MRVKELIEKLKEYPEDVIVCTDDIVYGRNEIEIAEMISSSYFSEEPILVLY